MCTLSFTTPDRGGHIPNQLAGLPASFSYRQARRCGLSDRRLYSLRDSGHIEQIGRGLYRLTEFAEQADLDLVEIAHRAPPATLCLTSGLARHGLTDEIPAAIDIALPRGRRRPRTRAPVAWHAFNQASFALGRTEMRLDRDTSIGLYLPERCIVDAFRLRHTEGSQLGVTALRRWLRRGGSPAALLDLAKSFPHAEPSLRAALEILG